MYPNDLILAACFVVWVSLATFHMGRLVARRSHALALLVGSGTVVAMCAYVWLLHERLIIVRWIAASSAIVLSNVIPPAALLLAGIVSQQAEIPRIRRYGIVLAMSMAAASTVARHLVPTAPLPSNPWYLEDVCVQTTPSSCSAASAASLLRYHGIQATEREMMRLCLTSSHGTPPLGLYRGLKLKTRDRSFDVRVLAKPVREYHASELPAVLLLSAEAPVVAFGTWRDRLEHGQNGHTVVLYAFTVGGEAVVGDPAIGLRAYSLKTLERTYQGSGVTLVRRAPRPTSAESTNRLRAVQAGVSPTRCDGMSAGRAPAKMGGTGHSSESPMARSSSASSAVTCPSAAMTSAAACRSRFLIAGELWASLSKAWPMAATPH